VADDQWKAQFDEDIRRFDFANGLGEFAVAAAPAAAAYYGGGGGDGGNPKPAEPQYNTFMEYMNAEAPKDMSTQQAAAIITKAANEGLIPKSSQLDYLMIYG
jgi:hypothetical protein